MVQVLCMWGACKHVSIVFLYLKFKVVCYSYDFSVKRVIYLLTKTTVGTIKPIIWTIWQRFSQMINYLLNVSKFCNFRRGWKPNFLLSKGTPYISLYEFNIDFFFVSYSISNLNRFWDIHLRISRNILIGEEIKHKISARFVFSDLKKPFKIWLIFVIIYRVKNFFFNHFIGRTFKIAFFLCINLKSSHKLSKTISAV